MIVKCDKCGKEFEKSDKRAKESLKRGWKMFCSDECKKSYKTKKVICECVNCGKTFERMLSQIRGATFCSKSCANSYHNSERVGEKNPNYVDGAHKGRDYLTKAFRTYEWVCTICGNDDNDVIEVHHIDKNRTNSDVDNLICLCANCHRKVHRGSYSITDEIKNKRKLKNNGGMVELVDTPDSKPGA